MLQILIGGICVQRNVCNPFFYYRKMQWAYKKEEMKKSKQALCPLLKTLVASLWLIVSLLFKTIHPVGINQ
jgi:hypothetical protein